MNIDWLRIRRLAASGLALFIVMMVLHLHNPIAALHLALLPFMLSGAVAAFLFGAIVLIAGLAGLAKSFFGGWVDGDEGNVQEYRLHYHVFLAGIVAVAGSIMLETFVPMGQAVGLAETRIDEIMIFVLAVITLLSYAICRVSTYRFGIDTKFVADYMHHHEAGKPKNRLDIDDDGDEVRDENHLAADQLNLFK